MRESSPRGKNDRRGPLKLERRRERSKEARQNSWSLSTNQVGETGKNRRGGRGILLARASQQQSKYRERKVKGSSERTSAYISNTETIEGNLPWGFKEKEGRRDSQVSGTGGGGTRS